MKNKNESYLINILEEGRNIKVVLFSHNSYWPYLQILENRYKNFSLAIFGSSTYYMERRKDYNLEDCDFIIYYSSNYFEESELNKLKEIAFKISNDNNKRVTIGYSSVIPINERENKLIEDEVKLVSFSGGKEYVESTFGTPYFTPIDVTNMVLKTHDELENQKVKNKLK